MVHWGFATSTSRNGRCAIEERLNSSAHRISPTRCGPLPRLGQSGPRPRVPFSGRVLRCHQVMVLDTSLLEAVWTVGHPRGSFHIWRFPLSWDHPQCSGVKPVKPLSLARYTFCWNVHSLVLAPRHRKPCWRNSTHRICSSPSVHFQFIY